MGFKKMDQSLGGDLDSDWVVQKDTPHYGLKKYASVDTNQAYVLATTMTPSLR